MPLSCSSLKMMAQRFLLPPLFPSAMSSTKVEEHRTKSTSFNRNHTFSLNKKHQKTFCLE